MTLVEVLVSVAVVATLSGVLLPSLSGARQAGRAAACLSNVRQLGVAVQVHGADRRDRAPAGAPDFVANRTRWFGSRAGGTGVFEPAGGTLSAYLGETAAATVPARACPEFSGALRELAERGAGFERGCGGYGYNNAFVGVTRGRGANGRWRLVTDRQGATLAGFANPAGTVAFADAAFATGEGAGAAGVVEYAFVEPRFWPEVVPSEATRADPSMHFRHGGRAGGSARASLVYLDGHGDARGRTFTWSSGLYGDPGFDAMTGWTGSGDDNTLFGEPAGAPVLPGGG
jgi:type II secretory pathway pseudopilin PulG